MQLKKSFFLIIQILLLSSVYAQDHFMRTYPLLNDVMYNPYTDFIYATVGPDYELGNSVMLIDPENGDITDYIEVSDSPTRIWINEEGTYLYVFHDLGFIIEKINLTTHSVETIYSNGHQSLTSSQLRNAEFYRIFEYPENSENYVVYGRSSYYIEDDTLNTTVRPGFSIAALFPGFTYHKDTDNFIDSRKNVNLIKFSNNELDTVFSFPLRNEDQSISKSPFLIEDKLVFKSGTVLQLEQNSIREISGFHDSPINSYLTSWPDPWFPKLYHLKSNSGFNVKDINSQEDTIFYSRESGITNYIPNYRKAFGINNGNYVVHCDILGNSKLIFTKKCGSAVSQINLVPEQDEICEEDTIAYWVDQPFKHIVWSNLETTNPTYYYSRTSRQEVYAHLFDENGCLVAKTDTISLRTLPNDKTYESYSTSIISKCPLDTINVLIDDYTSGGDFFILNSMDTLFSDRDKFTTHEEGIYSIVACEGPGCCDYRHDVKVIHIPVKHPEKAKLLYPDTINYCQNDRIELLPEKEFPFYEWDCEGCSSFSENYGRKMKVSEPGKYKIRYYNEYGCYGEWSNIVYVDSFQNSIYNPVLKQNDLDENEFYIENPDPNYIFDWYLEDSLIYTNHIGTVEIYSPGYVYVIASDSNSCYSGKSNLLSLTFEYNDFDIEGYVMYDTDKSETLTSEDEPLVGWPVNQWNSPIIQLTNQEGRFEYNIRGGLFTRLQINDLDENNYRVITPEDNRYYVNGYNQNSSDPIIYFLVSAAGFEEGYLNSVTSIGRARCDETSYLDHRLVNLDSEVVHDVEICFEFDPAVNNIVSDSLFSAIGDKYCMNIDSLNPHQSHNVSFNFKIPDFSFIGQELEFLTEVSSTSRATQYVGRTNVLRTPVLCSYDPNDKLVFPEYHSNYILFEDTLLYTIRFQNTGNDTAYSVRLEDYISENLDINTFKPIASSHQYQVKLDKNNRFVEVFFDNIFLPDSIANPLESQGYFSFTILADLPLDENTLVENNASIFFDSNPPIVTNTTKSIMVSEIPTVNIHERKSGHFAQCIDILPNPTKGNLSLITKCDDLIGRKFEVYITSALGKDLLKFTDMVISNQGTVIDISDLLSGVYSITIRDQNTNESAGLRITKI